jgi:Phage capsid family
MPVQLNAVSSVLLPPNITGPIFSKATEESAVQQLARRVPLSVNANTAIPVSMDVPVADWVAEGGVKPAAQTGAGVKIMTGKKVALLLPVSEEVAMTNPAGLYAQLQQDAPTAIARAFDYAAINGKSLRTGGAGPFTDNLSNATNLVALGTASQANGGLYNDIVTGAGRVVDKNYDFTGIAADPRMKIDAALQTDTQGRPLFNDANNAVINGGTLAGFPAFFNKGVSGKYWRAGDQTQLVTIVGTPTGGTFVLSSGGNSATLAYNAAAATVQTAIQAWGGIYAAVTVSGSAGGPYTITFPAVASNVTAAAAPFAVDQRLLTGGTAATSKATVAATGAGGTDSLLRGVGGDWSQAAWGQGMDIAIRLSREASYFDGTNWHSAFQENLVLLLIEAYYGFVMGSNDAFVLYTKGTAPF